MAGESAREAARRMREKAGRVEAAADLWERGALGEEITARALAALPEDDWAVLHDVRWPGRRYANVDHVAIGPPGVFVIDSKNWSGRVSVKEHVLRQNGRSRETAVAGAADAGLAVAQLVTSVPADKVHPVLCFVSGQDLSGWARDVMVCGTDNVVAMLRSRPAVLTPEERRLAALDLDASLRAAVEAPLPVRRMPPPVPSPRKPVKATTNRSEARAARARRRRRADATKAVLALVGVGVLLYVPGVVDTIAGWLAAFFVS